MHGFARGVATAAVALVWCSVARGQPPSSSPALAPHVLPGEPLRADYLAPPGCPTSHEFVRRVLTVAPNAHAASPRELARVLVVRIRPHGKENTGTLSLRTGSGVNLRVELQAPCSELVTRLAHLAALALDPERVLASDLPLSPNPYRSALAPPRLPRSLPPLPPNPYRRGTPHPVQPEASAPLPSNPYRGGTSRASRAPVSNASVPDDLPANPYR